MRIPRATYRLQFNSRFGFKQALDMVEYLSMLGISDIYASPIFAAREGSIHGYDVVDPTRINPEIGSLEEFESLTSSAQRLGMGWLQDIVPNHMAYDGKNTMLMDVFENGSASEFYHFFDVEWDHAYESMKGRLLAPFLGKPYAQALQDGDIKIEYDRNGFSVRYYNLNFPLKIETYAKVLAPYFYSIWTLKENLKETHADFIKFVGILYVLKSFPCQELSGERFGQIRFIKDILWELYNSSEAIKAFIDKNLREINGEDADSTRSHLHSLLYDQFFRLSYWKVASEELNYRRFFSINELISLKIEQVNVFNQCHKLILELVEKGQFTGLRIDHIDGLFDPSEYLSRLKDKTGGAYVIVEKILALDEDLPADWPIQGTSGYEYLNYINGLFVRKDHVREFDRIYRGFIRESVDYEELLRQMKGIIIERFMTGDVDNLAHMMKHLSSMDRGGLDITIYGLKRAIHETLSFFPVYRTYINSETISDADMGHIEKAMERAKGHNPDLVQELEYLEKYLRLRFDDYVGEEDKKNWLHFIMRFQQFSGPLMAKGFEDTTLYVYNRLISLNEVGGEPFSFGISLEQFHDFNRNRLERWPNAMSASSTHDTKRGEDVRARINVLSELPQEWERCLIKWSEINETSKSDALGVASPSRNDEYFFYQTLVGAFPFKEEEQRSDGFLQRIKDYIIKAIREAKQYTGWIKPDEAYESGYLAFVDSVLNGDERNAFLHDFIPFQKMIAHYGILNSLSQTLVKITTPGVPDFYQGTELWDLSLVVPDNRRPVNYEQRKRFLQEVTSKGEASLFADLLQSATSGKIKLFLIHQALMARTGKAKLFESGAYIPLTVGGKRNNHVISFARQDGNSWSITVAPRFTTGLVSEGEYPLGFEIWKDTRIILPNGAPQVWNNVITEKVIHSDGSLEIGAILTEFPVAFLLSE